MSDQAMLLDEPPSQSRMGKKSTKPDASPAPELKPRTKKSSAPGATAESMAERQREISVSEFFAKNRHLLGFDNPRKALLTAVKEAVDNALDACEEAAILPDILVELRARPDAGEDRFVVIVQDNGPGIVRKQIENIFGKLLYGSKFHRLKMSRGQQGIGISAAGMYGLITTGKPVRIISKTGPKKPAHEVVLKMDTSKNRADVVSETEHPEDDALFPEGHGTRVEIELVGKYFKGDRSVDQYIQLTSIANPHARFTYITPPTSTQPDIERFVHERGVNELPEATEEIKPHPHGIELGTLIGMLERTSESQLGGFFANEFCRITTKVGQEVVEAAGGGLTTRTSVKKVGHKEAERLYKALQEAKVMAPPTNCLSPIGVRTMIKGLEQGLAPDFIAVSSRPPAVYRGRPFVIEAGVAFGGNLPADDPAKVFRFANRVPLQYQQSACASFKAVAETNWKAYALQQPRGSLPIGPLVVMIHMASVWVPFTSESKEAIADYDEIRKEMRLALMDCGRKLGTYLRKRAKMRRAGERRDIFRRYIGEVAKACESLTGGSVEAQEVYNALLATARTKTIETDQVLDEEGKVVGVTGGASRDDETVFIRELTDDDARGALPAADDGAEEPSAEVKPRRSKRSARTDSGLFGDESESSPATDAPGAKKKGVKKKVVKKKKGG